MTWDEMIAKLRASGVPTDLLPVWGSAEGCYGLRHENGRLVVSITERGSVQDIADFPGEERAVDFIHDREVMQFKIDGDTRFDQWNADPTAFPLPRAEEFGGRTRSE